MGLGDLGSVVIILFIFALIHLFLALTIGIAEIKRNWPKYKCNPGVIPFAAVFDKDPKETAQECIKDIQIDFMTVFLEPIYSGFEFLATNGAYFNEIFNQMKFFGNESQGQFFSGIGNIKGRISNTTSAIGNTVDDITNSFGMVQQIFNNFGNIVLSVINTVTASQKQLPGTILKMGTGF